MITAKAEGEETIVTIKGDELDIISEAVHTVAACVDVIAKNNKTPHEAALYALVMSAAKRLKGKGYDIDTRFLGMSIMTTPLDMTESAPREAATSTVAQE